MFSAGEWIVLEQCLTEVTVNCEHFPTAAWHAWYAKTYTEEQFLEIWERWGFRMQITVVACLLVGDQTPPAKKIRAAYERLCSRAP